jgi:hypothetical protein
MHQQCTCSHRGCRRHRASAELSFNRGNHNKRSAT